MINGLSNKKRFVVIDPAVHVRLFPAVLSIQNLNLTTSAHLFPSTMIPGPLRGDSREEKAVGHNAAMTLLFELRKVTISQNRVILAAYYIKNKEITSITYSKFIQLAN